MDLSSALLVSSIEYKTLLKDRLNNAKNNINDSNNNNNNNKIIHSNNDNDNDGFPQFVHSWRRHLNNDNKHNNNNNNKSNDNKYNNSIAIRLNDLTLNDNIPTRNTITNTTNNTTNNNWYKEFREKEYNDKNSWNLLIETDDDIINNEKSNSPIRSPNTKSPIKLFQNASSSSLLLSSPSSTKSYSPKRNNNNNNSNKNYNNNILEIASKKYNDILLKRFFYNLKTKANIQRNLRNNTFQRLSLIKKRKCFRNWLNIYHASILSQKVKHKSLWKHLCIWNQKSLKSKRVSDAMYNYAEQHYKLRKYQLLMKKFENLIIIKKFKQHEEYKTDFALKFRNKKLLKGIVTAWKYQTKKFKKEKLSKEEHIQRLERIKKLVNTIGNKNMKISSPQKSNINTSDDIVEDNKMMINSEKQNLRNNNIIDYHHDAKYFENDNNNNDIIVDVEQPKAPEKEIINRNIIEEKETKAARAINRTIKTPENLSNRNAKSTPTAVSNKTSNITEKPKTYPSKEELEMRAVERRKKALELRKQAEERVAKRQKEEEIMKSSKLQVEEEIVDKIREERRNKIEKEKALSVRNKEIQLELQRKLETAIKFHNTQLIMRVGFVPWCRLVELKKMNLLKAANFREDYLLQSSWIAFYGYVMMLKNERVRKEYKANAFAVAHFRRNLLKKTWKCWCLYRKLLRAKAKAVTGHFSRYCIVRRAYKAWRLTLERLRRKQILKLRSVEPRGNKCTMKFYWNRWYEYLQQSLVEREINNRADLTWNKIQKWLS